MDDITYLRQEVAQLRQIVESLVMDNMMNGQNNQNGMVGDGVTVMPVIGGGSGSGCAFEFNDGKIKNGGFFIARKYHPVTEVTVNENYTGKAYLEISMSGETGSVVFGEPPEDPTDTYTYVPLYEFENGSVTRDFRASPVIQYYE